MDKKIVMGLIVAILVVLAIFLIDFNSEDIPSTQDVENVGQEARDTELDFESEIDQNVESDIPEPIE